MKGFKTFSGENRWNEFEAFWRKEPKGSEVMGYHCTTDGTGNPVLQVEFRSPHPSVAR